MNVLITGGAGFIGYHLGCLHASHGDEVYLVDNLFKTSVLDGEMQTLMQKGNVEFVTADLTASLDQLELPKTFDVVYHLAAINGTRLFYEMPYQVATTNLWTTLRLLNWLQARTVGSLVYTSSSEVYAGAEDYNLLSIPTNESVPVVFSQPTKPRFSYGTSKFMGEFLCLQFGSTFKVPVSVIRYHNIYGPRMGDKHVIPEFIMRLQSGENPFRIIGGGETRAFCYIDDAVHATRAIAENAACAGEVLHVGNSEEEISVRQLAQETMRALDVHPQVVELEGRSGSVSRRCPDTSKLHRLTGFRAAVPLNDGLLRTVAWYTAKATKPMPEIS